jgi:acyl-CoA dehydrogenase
VSAELDFISASVSGILADALSDDADVDVGARAWSALEDTGMTLVGVPEESGGSGGTLAHAAAVLGAAAEHSAPIPLAETAWLAAWLLAAGGRPVPAGPLTAVAVAEGTLDTRRDGDDLVLSGRIERVPYLRECSRLWALLPFEGAHVVAGIATASVSVEKGENLAGEPRDDAILDAVRVPSADIFAAGDGIDPAHFAQRLAAARLVLLAGVSRRALLLTIEHVTTRVQFGRPLARFQSVQHRVATIAAELRVLETAAEIAVSELDSPAADQPIHGACAVVAGYDAARIVAANAHQLLGAMGFTREHALHRATTRLWSWRQELGPLQSWIATISSRTLHSDSTDVWAQIATQKRTD